MANITQINVNGTTYDLKDNISGYTTAYDGTTTSDTKYDALFLETLASGVNTVKVGLDMDLLWTNSAPTSSFSAQTVSVDLSKYSLVLLLMNGDDTTQKYYIFAPLGETTSYQYQSEASTGVWFHFRSITATTSGVTFGDAYDHAYNSWGRSTNNLRAIPYQIYGVR